MSTTYEFCNKCGHRNPPSSAFCSACGSVLDRLEEHTITLSKVDPLQDAPGAFDDVVVDLDEIPQGSPLLVVRSGDEEGEYFQLCNQVTSIGRHAESDVVLDDITVSRRHCEVIRSGEGYRVRDVGSLNGTYLNQQRVDEARVSHGDEIQIGKFHLVFVEGTSDLP